jgi:hypothetical protein
MSTNYICSKVGTTDFCEECAFAIPFQNVTTISCDYNTLASMQIMQFPLYYKLENNYFVLNGPSKLLKVTLHEKTFFASSITDKYEVGKILLTADAIAAEAFSACIEFIQTILSEADLQVTKTSGVSALLRSL